MMTERKLIDDAFYVEETDWKTWNSKDKNGEGIITALTEESCINSTRIYLKWVQDGFPKTKQYSGEVAGKL